VKLSALPQRGDKAPADYLSAKQVWHFFLWKATCMFTDSKDWNKYSSHQ